MAIYDFSTTINCVCKTKFSKLYQKYFRRRIRLYQVKSRDTNNALVQRTPYIEIAK